MDNNERIKNGDFLFGLGIVVSDILEKEIFNNEKKAILIPLKEGEETVEYEGKLEELRIICENEQFVLATSSAYFSYKNRFKEEYVSIEHNEVVLLKEIDVESESPTIEESLQIGKTIKRIKDYLQTPINELFFFFYFPENIIIDKGKACASIISQTEWEHKEQFGEH